MDPPDPEVLLDAALGRPQVAGEAPAVGFGPYVPLSVESLPVSRRGPAEAAVGAVDELATVGETTDEPDWEAWVEMDAGARAARV